MKNYGAEAIDPPGPLVAPPPPKKMRYLNKAPSPAVITRSNFLAIFVLRVIRIPIASANVLARPSLPHALLFFTSAKNASRIKRAYNFHDVPSCTGNAGADQESRTDIVRGVSQQPGNLRGEFRLALVVDGDDRSSWSNPLYSSFL